MGTVDQAHNLRLIAGLSPKNKARIISVTSGKGGVGKTSIVINLAIYLQKMGKKVAVLDADLGLANIDVMLGYNPKYNLRHVIFNEIQLKDIIIDGPEGIKIIPGASGIPDLADLGDFQREKIINSLITLENDVDIILIDTGAGLSRNVRNFVTASDDAVVITTPDPAAITDAYSMIKVISDENFDLDIKLVVNMAKTKYEAQEISDRMVLVVKQFLNKHLNTLGYVIGDKFVVRAVRSQQPVAVLFPSSEASKCIKLLAHSIIYGSRKEEAGGVKNFLLQLLKRN